MVVMCSIVMFIVGVLSCGVISDSVLVNCLFWYKVVVCWMYVDMLEVGVVMEGWVKWWIVIVFGCYGGSLVCVMCVVFGWLFWYGECWLIGYWSMYVCDVMIWVYFMWLFGWWFCYFVCGGILLNDIGWLFSLMNICCNCLNCMSWNCMNLMNCSLMMCCCCWMSWMKCYCLFLLWWLMVFVMWLVLGLYMLIIWYWLVCLC